MLCSHRMFGRNAARKVNVTLQAFFSRKSNKDNDTDVYKLVRSKDDTKDINNNYLGASPNWELLAPQGYRFYMPGSVGPAWHDETTTANIEFGIPPLVSGKRESSTQLLDFNIQECPILLREGVLEMFPGIDLRTYQLTVVTLKQRLYRRGRRQDVDDLAKNFLLAAQEICSQLKVMGYWADFINPFSGHPYYAHWTGKSLYKTDERFRCLGFKIASLGNCKVISSSESNDRTFVGNLFTTAPTETPILHDIVSQVNC